MKRLQGPKVPPRWRKSILQEVTAALTGRLEELDVAPQPCLEETDRCVDKEIDGWRDRQVGGQREQGIDELLISFLP